MEPIVSIRNLNHYYGANALKKQVLFDINLDIVPGEIVIMTGPSGSGKTTLLTLLGGLRSVQSGRLRCLGHELAGASETNLVAVRRHIGYIFQAHNLLPFMTARQNVGMSLEMHQGINRRVAQMQASEMLEQVGLGDRISYYPDKLSGGQKQRVAIARALVSQPRLVLADEPTASLDKKTGRDVVDLMHQLVKQQGCTILLVTHDNRILDIADRIVHMEDGKLVSSTPRATSPPIPTINIDSAHLPDLVDASPSSLVDASVHRQLSDNGSHQLDPLEDLKFSPRQAPDKLPSVSPSQIHPKNNVHNNPNVELATDDASPDRQISDFQIKPSLTNSVLVPGLNPAAFATYSSQSLLAAGFSEQTIADTNFLLATPPPALTQQKRQRVVCIDTDIVFLRTVAQLLDQKYFETIAIEDPLQALVKILGCKPDLILLEVKIPNFNGYQLCNLLRQNPQFKNTPIIITTKQKRNIIGRIRAKASGASGYLVKPLSQVNLMTTVFPHIL